MNHMLHGAVARIGGAIKRIEGADGAKYSITKGSVKIEIMSGASPAFLRNILEAVRYV